VSGRAGVPPSGGRISKPIRPKPRRLKPEHQRSRIPTADQVAKDVAKLVEPLNDCCEQLGRSIGDALKQKLLQIKSGTAKATAKALCERKDSVTESRRSAIASALSARVDRSLACE
jgi:hypothetical protein